MSKIDTLLEAAREAAKNAEGEEKVKADARAAAILEMKGEGFKLSDDEVGGLISRKEKEAADSLKEQLAEWEEIIGMDLEATKVAVADLGDDSEADEDGDTDPAFSRLSSQLESVKSEKDSLAEQFNGLNTRYSGEKVNRMVEDAFRSANLDSSFLEPAKRLASYDDLVEKAAKGEEITAEDIGAKVSSVKELSGVWFKAAEEDTPGPVIKPRQPSFAIPPTETPETPQGLTDEQRMALSSSPFR